MEVVVDGLRHGLADAVHGLEVREAGFGDALGRAEAVQQGAFALGSDAGDLVELGGYQGLGAARPVAADGEAVGLVAQALQEIADGAVRRHQERLAAGQMDALAPGIALGPLGDGGDAEAASADAHAEIGEGRERARQLPGAAVEQHQVGPLPSMSNLR